MSDRESLAADAAAKLEAWRNANDALQGYDHRKFCERIQGDDLKKRIGRIRVEKRLISDCPEMLFAIFARCIVVRCEVLWYLDAFDYEVLSPDLPICNSEIPRYDAIFRDSIDPDKGRQQFVEFRRIDVPR
jgi:hypothetical protein